MKPSRINRLEERAAMAVSRANAHIAAGGAFEDTKVQKELDKAGDYLGRINEAWGA